MQEIKILIAEDEASALEIYNDAISDFNDENTDINIVKTICQTKEEALESIQNEYFDAAFIDLNLSRTENDGGIELIKAIQDNARYPIYIVSGQIQNVEHDFNNKFISKHDKDTVDTNELLLEIKKIYETGLTKVLGSKGILEKSLDDIFWNHLSESKEHWIEHSLNGDELEKIISRYTLTHLLEYLQINDDGTSIKNVDSSEMYIKPYIKDVLYPGTIVENDEKKYLVLSPACDLTQGNCDCVTLIKLTELFNLDTFSSIQTKIATVKEEIITHEGKKQELVEEIKDLIDIESLEKYGINLRDYQNVKNILIKNEIDRYEQEFNTKLGGTKFTEVRKNIVDSESVKKKLLKEEGKLKNLLRQFISNNKGDRYYFLPKFLDFKAKVIDFQDIQTVDITEIGRYKKIMNISLPFIKDIQSKFSSYYARQGSPDFDFSKITEEYYTAYLERQ